MGSGASRSATKPKLYMFRVSAPCRGVLMAAKAAKIQIDCETVDLMKGEHKNESFLKINPDHTVPTLVDNDLHLWESRAIMAYLVDKYAPDHYIYPKDPVKRARINRLLFRDVSFIALNVEAFLMPQLWHHEPADPQKQAEVEKVFDYLEDTIERGGNWKYLTGDQETVADLSISASLSMLELVDWQFDRWAKVNEWRQRVKELPYYAEVNKPLDEFKAMIKSQHHEE